MWNVLQIGFRTLLFCGILYASYLLILLSLPYVHFEANVDFLKTKQLIYHIDVWRWSFYIHVFTSPLVILSGLLQFSPTLIRKAPKVHRISGKIYLIVLIFITGPAAFVMSLYANGSYPAQVSFTLLSILWVCFGLAGYWFIRKKNYLQHSNFLLRSYALTLSAVTLRLYAYLFDAFNIDTGGPVETYILLSYLSWIPNLLFVELIIKLGYTKSLLKKISN